MVFVKCPAVIFDLFGTLVADARADIYPLMAAALGLPLAEFHQEWTRSYPDRTLGQKSFGQCISAMGFEGTGAEEAAKIRTGEVARCLSAVKPGVYAALVRLKAAGVRLGLLSNASLEVPQIWPACSLARFFEQPLFSCDVGLMKPQPEIYRLVCARLGVDPSAAVFVGDGGDGEIAGAAAAGMTAVQVDNGRPKAAEAQAFIASIEDLLEILGVGAQGLP